MPQLYLQTFGGLAILREGAPAEGAGAQRRRLALLALLAAAGDRGISREKLLFVLWPESDLERARKKLAQAVYALRRDLGAEELVQGTNDLRLNTDLLSSDLAEFQRAIAEERKEDAVALYKGPFLDGIFFDEAPEFERWAELERAHHAREYTEALESLAIQAANRGEPRLAASYWRKLANTDPLNAKAALGLMRGLAAAGDRAEALQHYRVYQTLLRQELELAPDAELRRYADDLRQEKSPIAAPPPAPAEELRGGGPGELGAHDGRTLPGGPRRRPAGLDPRTRAAAGWLQGDDRIPRGRLSRRRRLLSQPRVGPIRQRRLRMAEPLASGTGAAPRRAAARPASARSGEAVPPRYNGLFESPA